MSIPNEDPFPNFGLGETADQLRQTVRAFAANDVAPTVEMSGPAIP